MKNIKILESIAVCLFSILLFSFAVVQEKNQPTSTSVNTVAQQAKPASQQTTPTLTLQSDRELSFNFIPSVSLSKVITWVIGFVIGTSLLILIVGFLFYNIYSIRP
jgi:hypothetical protein